MFKKITVVFISITLILASIIPVFAEELPAAQDEPASATETAAPETDKQVEDGNSSAEEAPAVTEPEAAVPDEQAEAEKPESVQEKEGTAEISAEVSDQDVMPEDEQEPAMIRAVAPPPEVISLSLKDAGFCCIRVSWSVTNCDKVNLIWSSLSDFRNARICTYGANDAYADLTVPAWKTIYVKAIPIKGSVKGTVKTASVESAAAYKPGKLRPVDTTGTITGGTNELDIRVLDKAGREIPKKYYRLVRASDEVIGPNKGYVTFTDDYAGFAKMSFAYTVYPPKPVSFRVVPFAKDSVYFRAGMNYISKRYDYCEIVYANNKQFKNWKAVKIASKSDPKVLAKGLKANTTYYARAKYVKKIGGKIYKSDYVPLTFKTAGNPPWPTTASATTKSLIASMKKNKSFTLTLPQKLAPQDAQDYVWAVQENYPQYDKFNFCCNYDSNGYLIEKITFTYNKTKAARAAKLKAKIDSITKYARKKGYYKNRASYVNWRMKKMCSYDWSAYYSDDWEKHADAYSAYGCLVKGKAVCEGYSLAFNAIMLELGIPTKRMSGGGHAWNMVKIGNRWYHVDVTWNDTSDSNRYLLTRTH